MAKGNGKIQGESGVWACSTSHKNNMKAKRQTHKSLRQKAKKAIGRERS